MIVHVSVAGRTFVADLAAPIDISIPVRFNGPQPSAFSLPAATSLAVEAGAFVGDTRRGGACNCETVTLNPHGSGTHTECVGHVSNARMHVGEMVHETLLPAVLVTALPAVAEASQEEGVVADGDVVVTRGALEAAVAALGDVPREFFRALVVRTAPNEPAKLTAAYSGANPPYITRSAMRLVRELGTEHLLVDLPSVDREEDGGALAAHRIFWGLPATGHDIPEIYSARTITEMVYVSDAVGDGVYALNLQLPHFMLDAAPSRPFLFTLAESQ